MSSTIKSILVLVLGWYFAVPLLYGQQNMLRLMTYNVENLFDTCRDERFDDAEYQPNGEKRWNTSRYRRKLQQIAQVVVAAGGAAPIDLVALCEVENDSVVRDLTQRTRLRRLGYRFLMTQSNDTRGIDVALLYQPERFRVCSIDTLRVPLPVGIHRPTRDILHVGGCTPSGDTLDVFVCHFPSRSRGQTATESYRMEAAQCVRRAADSIVVRRQRPSVVILGDFNDEPTDRSLVEGLGAVGSGRFADNPDAPWVLMSDTLHAMGGEVAGTYYYSKQWNRLDHIVVNATMVGRTCGLRVPLGACRILAFPFLLERTEGKIGEWKIKRTYMGEYYRGGTSDHLPLLLQLEY